jgi:hypothetical protein
MRFCRIDRIVPACFLLFADFSYIFSPKRDIGCPRVAGELERR